MRDVDPERIEDLAAVSSKGILYTLFNLLIEDIERLHEEHHGDIFAKGVHAQLGAALNLGAERIAEILRAADTEAIDHDQARRALKGALPGLRTALLRCGIKRRG